MCSYQVSASLDALIEISSGKVNIHVLMAMAAFASIFMGNSLEGGLLLAMFNLAHIGELNFDSQTDFQVSCSARSLISLCDGFCSRRVFHQPIDG